MLREASIVQDWINEGMEKGMEKGEIKALQEAILDILEERFGMPKKNIGKKIKAIDDPVFLKSLHRKTVKVASLEEFIKLMEEAFQ
ncbi:MAG: hypothetical protein IMW93_03485 [Thermoanaerobacteraceae bacterium]|nr:hypothetical protein [Thermoanaerobacteraceae bacterium]